MGIGVRTCALKLFVVHISAEWEKVQLRGQKYIETINSNGEIRQNLQYTQNYELKITNVSSIMLTKLSCKQKILAQAINREKILFGAKKNLKNKKGKYILLNVEGKQ